MSDDKVYFNGLVSEGNSLTMGVEGGPCHVVIDAFVGEFMNSGATNFLTMTFTHEESKEEFEVTIQKVSGESTCNQLARLKAENEKLKAELAKS